MPLIEPHVEINTAISGSFEFVEGQPGITVNEEEFVKLVAEAVRSENFTGTIEVPGEILQPTYTMDQIKANTVKISSATTSFANSSSDSRVFNIKKMCGLLSEAPSSQGNVFGERYSGPPVRWKMDGRKQRASKMACIPTRRAAAFARYQQRCTMRC